MGTNNQEQQIQDLIQENRKLLLMMEKAQKDLIHQEKMAGLGQLLAGVSHELNTPAGAILNCASAMNQDYSKTIEHLVQILTEMPPELLSNFFASVQVVTHLSSNLATREERLIAKDLASIFDKNAIESPANLIRNLSIIGFNKDNIEPLIPLLKTSKKSEIYETLFLLGMNSIHLRDIQTGIHKIIELLKATKLYSHSTEDVLSYTKLDQDILTSLTLLHNRLKQGIKVIQEFESLPEIPCYADQLNQVWTNLINNAIEAMQGKGQIAIRLKKRDEKHVQVEIEDNGPGIPDAIKDRIFEPYFTTKPKGEGTGLGLSISKTIVEKHKGSIQVESAHGHTIFRVILPLNPLSEGAG